MKNLSCVIISRCEDSLPRTLRSVIFCDEVVVVTEKKERCKKNLPKKVSVISHPLNNNFSQQRNFGLKVAKGNWVLFVDSDEVVEKELQEEIKKAIRTEKHSAFYIRRKEFADGEELRFGEIMKVRRKGLIRLVRKDAGYFMGRVHERFVLDKGKKASRIRRGFLLHFSHKSIEEFLRKINAYSTIRAQDLYEQGKRFRLIELSYPFFKFVYTYLFLLGFLDGYWGFVYSFMMSFHSFLVRAKLFTGEVKKTR